MVPGQGHACRHDRDRGGGRDGGLDRAEPQDATVPEMPQMPPVADRAAEPPAGAEAGAVKVIDWVCFGCAV